MHALVGPVEAVDAGAGTVRVLGRRKVRRPGACRGLRIGDWVRLSGHRQADGVLVASRVGAPAAAATPRQAQVSGRVEAITSGRDAGQRHPRAARRAGRSPRGLDAR